MTSIQSLSQATPPMVHKKSEASTPIPTVDPGTTKYQELFKRACSKAMKAMGITRDLCAGFTAMGPNSMDCYRQYKIFRDAKQALHEEHIDEDTVMGDTVIEIANYREWWGTVPSHWVVTYVILSESDSSDSDSDDSDDSGLIVHTKSIKRITRRLSFDELFDTSSDEEAGYESPDAAAGYEPPPFDENEEAFVPFSPCSTPAVEVSPGSGAQEAVARSRKRKRVLVPTRYSKRVATRARKKRRPFGQ